MRDLERLQDEMEYRVSPGQLRLVFLGVLAVACAIFAVGVSVGKRLEPGSTALAVDPLAEIDRAAAPAAEAAQEEEPEGEPEAPALTYHNELTQREPARRNRAALPRDPEERDRASEEERPAPAAPAEPAAPAPRARAPRSAPAPAPAPDPEEPVPTEPARPEEPEPGESAVYTLQVGSFETREEAGQFAADLRTRGHPTFLVRTSMPERGTWYRVRVGPFHSRREATGYQARFERGERLPTFLVRRRFR